MTSCWFKGIKEITFLHKMVLAIKEKLEADNEEKIRRPEAESEMKRMLEALKILR